MDSQKSGELHRHFSCPLFVKAAMMTDMGFRQRRAKSVLLHRGGKRLFDHVVGDGSSVLGYSDARLPKATFVTRSSPASCSAERFVRFLDQSTTLWVESSSTDDSRLRGPRPISDMDLRSTANEPGDGDTDNYAGSPAACNAAAASCQIAS